MFCSVLLCFVLFCYVMLCYVLLFHIDLCNALILIVFSSINIMSFICFVLQLQLQLATPENCLFISAFFILFILLFKIIRISSSLKRLSICHIKPGEVLIKLLFNFTFEQSCSTDHFDDALASLKTCAAKLTHSKHTFDILVFSQSNANGVWRVGSSH